MIKIMIEYQDSKRNKVRPRRSTAYLAATSVMPSSIPQHLVNAVFDEATKKMMEMRELIKHPDPIIRARWIIELANEWGKLLLGLGKGNNRKGKREMDITLSSSFTNTRFQETTK